MSEKAGRTYGDVIVDSMWDGGVDALFFTSGSDIMFYQEAVARQNAEQESGIKLYTMTHEIVSLNAAMGYSAVSGKPVATAAHVAVGTLNYGSAIHGASRSRLPIIITAGIPPTATPGTIDGCVDAANFYTQQVPDQNGIVRQYMKWEHVLAYQDNPGTVFGRGIQIAMTEPRGPVYVSLPREVQMIAQREPGYARSGDLGIPLISEPGDEAVDKVIDLCLNARRPAIVVGLGGRDEESVAELARFADYFGIPVFDGRLFSYQCLDFDHPLYRRNGDLSDADLVIVLESDIPWLPGASTSPSGDASIIVVDHDPLISHVPMVDFPASMRLVTDTKHFARKVLRMAGARLTESETAVLKQRREKRVADVSAHRKGVFDEASERFRTDVIDPVWASLIVASVIPDDAVVFDDTIDSAPVRRFLKFPGPAQYFHRPSSSGGWGIGAALGAKLALPDRTVVMVSGDGFYMFGVPTCALWAARLYEAPFLSVVFQNDSYNTGTEHTAKHYPKGYAEAAGFPGGYLDHPVDFAMEAMASGAYGENVTDAMMLEPALRRGLEAVKNGRCAVISIKVPKLLQLPPRA